VNAAPYRTALIAAWLASLKRSGAHLDERELRDRARAQLDATPAELERLTDSWRTRHEPDDDDAGDGRQNGGTR
jgi:hypothetical protein